MIQFFILYTIPDRNPAIRQQQPVTQRIYIMITILILRKPLIPISSKIIHKKHSFIKYFIRYNNSGKYTDIFLRKIRINQSLAKHYLRTAVKFPFRNSAPQEHRYFAFIKAALYVVAQIHNYSQ